MGLEKNNRIEEVVNSAMENLSELIDVNTVIGKPIITADSDYIFPIAKSVIGTLSCGGEYGKINLFKNSSDLPFSAGNGSIVSLKPCAFLIKKANGEYSMLNVDESSQEKIIEKASQFLYNIINKEENK